MASTQLSRTEQFQGLINTKEFFGKAKASFGGDKEKASTFLASMLDLYEGDDYLQKCDPKKVAMECMKAASLDLPLVKSLGFAYVVPFKGTATFQIGYKGYIQLAFRSGQVTALNADAIYEGEKVVKDRMAGTFRIEGEPTSTTPIGYFAYLELKNGMKKCEYMTIEELQAHGKKFSQSYGSQYSPWKTNFDAMAKKTVLKKIIKYAPMTTQMQMAEKMEVAAEETKANADAQSMMGSAGVIDIQATEVPVQQEPEEEVIPDAGF